MTFEELQNANASIKTLDMKGKQYAEVNQRIKVFRMLHPNGCIETDVQSNLDGVVVIKATVRDETGKVLATGHAYEKEGSSFINKTSYIENCETSAVGRALGLLGIGIDTSVASYEEVANAIEQQKITVDQMEQINTLLRAGVIDREKMYKYYRVHVIDDLTAEQADKVISQGLKNATKKGVA